MSEKKLLMHKLRKQNDFRTLQREQNALFSSCVLLDGIVYSLTNLNKNLIKLDLQNFKMEYIEHWKEIEFVQSEDILGEGTELFLLEQNGHRLMRLNVETKQYRYYDIECHVKEWGNYAAYAKIENWIYIFPRYVNKIIKINLETGQITKDYHLYQEIINTHKAIEESEGEYSFFEYGMVSENTVWLFQKNLKWVIAYDLQTDNWKEYELPQKIERCIHVTHRKEFFYILSAEGRVYVWNVNTGNMKLLMDCTKATINETFSRVAITEKKLFVLPSLSDDIYWMDLESEKIGIYSEYPEEFYYCAPKAWSKYMGCCEDDKNFYFAMRSSMYILCIDKQRSELKWLKPIMPSTKECFNRYYKTQEGKPIDEKKWSVMEVIDCMEDNFINGKNKEKNNFGKRIWDHLK